MWCVKFVLMAGSTEVWLGTEQMLDKRYMADSKEPVKSRALQKSVFPLIQQCQVFEEAG